MRTITGTRDVVFWAAFALLALPACSSFGSSPSGGGTNLQSGAKPRSGAVFCDIVKARRCASDLDIARGISLYEAATALTIGRTGQIGLDYSPEAQGRCGVNIPEAVEFHGAFPEGLPVCINCSEVLGPGKTYPDAVAVCRAQCQDLFFGPLQADGTAVPVKPPTAETIAYCIANAHVSTNAALNACSAGACSEGGTLLDFFPDPRRISEPVVWTDLIGAAPGGAEGNDLSRTTPATDTWAAGAVSSQRITRGDAWVEFSANRTNESIIVGLTEVPAACPAPPAPCPDTNPSWEPMNFAFFFRLDGRFTVTESGTIVAGPDINGSFGPYVAGERFRVRIYDNGNGAARVRFTRLIGPCIAGKPCNELEFYAPTGVVRYPMRVDASFFQPGATVTNVRLARIR